MLQMRHHRLPVTKKSRWFRGKSTRMQERNYYSILEYVGNNGKDNGNYCTLLIDRICQ